MNLTNSRCGSALFGDSVTRKFQRILELLPLSGCWMTAAELNSKVGDRALERF